ncbi:hypothetical protein [Natrarchaeobaculum aegyptiacum]|uniref:hypothetical protein n=1 Tax=Natrarchaeobaculum aegyptiacum TaxID=745377 RepID=UPI00126032A0|nr:hypothetical protein [Natrarchaeobaculum aegyptiacum]
MALRFHTLSTEVNCLAVVKRHTELAFAKTVAIDILLRVHAEESRAVRVSGFQPRTPPLLGNPFNPVVVVGG